jgi:hypothetical protein
MPNRDAWQEVPDPRGTRFVLPPRDLPKIRLIGAGVIAFGLLFDGIFLGVTASFWWPVLRAVLTGTAAVGPDLLLLVIPLLAALGMIIPIGLGALIGFGHAELLLTPTHAEGIDRCGPFRYRRRIAYTDIRRMVVDLTPVEVNDKPVTEGPWSDLGALTVERLRGTDEQRGVPLVIGYPKAVIAALGEELNRRISQSIGVVVDIAVRDENGDEVHHEPPPQPARSKAVLERTPEGISIMLPPLGFFRGSKGLGCFSILWLGFISIFGTFSVGMAVSGQPLGQVWPFLLGTLLFGAIGVGMFFFALRSGRRRAVIDVVGMDLLITEQSIGKANSLSWGRDEIVRVVVGKSGMEVNDVPVMELQVWPVNGKKIGLFREREDDELRWMAAEIRAALGLTEQA